MKNPETGGNGIVLSFYQNMSYSGEPFLVKNCPSSNLGCYYQLPPELTTRESYIYRGQSITTAKITGLHQFSLSSCLGKLILDGKVFIDIERHW